jgi:hypothetical protein
MWIRGSVLNSQKVVIVAHDDYRTVNAMPTGVANTPEQNVSERAPGRRMRANHQAITVLATIL